MEYRNPGVSPQTAQKLSAIERQFIFMRANGNSLKDIAKKLKKGTHAVCDMNKKFSRHIFNIRNAQFSELQKKVIDLKMLRLNFLKNQIEKVIKKLSDDEYLEDEPDWKYNDTLQIFLRLSDLMSACEYDMLSVGTNFKENLQPESNDLLENDIDVNDIPATLPRQVADVAETGNEIAENFFTENAVNKRFNKHQQRRATNSNVPQRTKRKKSKNKSP